MEDPSLWDQNQEFPQPIEMPPMIKIITCIIDNNV